MAKNKCTVYLGYEDEPITEKNSSLLNHMVNKVGGKPDWCNSEIVIPPCPTCSLNRPLILQVYAPLENSQFHRTLYIFGCINSACSNQSKNWICIRTQNLDKIEESGETKTSSISMNITWCNDSDDWNDAIVEDNRNEENGNVLKNDNNKVSDDEDESNSMENDIVVGFDNFNIDDKNANCGAQGGIMGACSISNAFAELEGEESEIVTVETPINPERDLAALLKQTPGIPRNLNKNLILNSFFIYVEEEKNDLHYQNQNLSDHIRDLIQEYQMRDENCKTSPESPTAVANDFEQEVYEKTIPLHGDVMFHNFISVIQKNPGQIVRYSRDAYPLLSAPLNEQIPKCQYCGNDCICELQILPTIIPKLKLDNNEPTPIEFGNVLIFTCLKSCWDTPDKMRLEHVIVQQEQ